MPDPVVTLAASALPAPSSFRPFPLQIAIDRRPEPRLQPLSLERVTGPVGSRLTAAATDPRDFDSISRVCAPGRLLTLTSFNIPGPRARTTRPILWFSGTIIRTRKISRGCHDHLEITAHNCPPALSTSVPAARWSLDSAGHPHKVLGQPLIFNADGLPNQSPGLTPLNGRLAPLFLADRAHAVKWTAAAAVDYLLAQLPASVSTANLNQLRRSRVPLSHLDISRLTLIDAFDRIVRQVGWRFTLDTVLIADTPVTLIRFYSTDSARRLFLPPSNLLPVAAASLADTPAPRPPLMLVARGALRRYEATFELVPGWDRTLESPDYQRYCAATNPDFDSVRDVFRKWVLNEDGHYDSPSSPGSTRYDLRSLFDGDDYEIRPRRFLPRFSQSPDQPLSASLKGGYEIEVSYTAGASWQPWDGACHILTDRCGIYLSVAQFDLTAWIAICKDALRFRLTGSIESDTPLQTTIPIRPGSPALPPVVIIKEYGPGFRYWKVTPASRHYCGPSTPGQFNDLHALRRTARLDPAVRTDTDPRQLLTLPYPRPDLLPGACLVHQRRRWLIDRVNIDWTNSPRTELQLKNVNSF